MTNGTKTEQSPGHRVRGFDCTLIESIKGGTGKSTTAIAAVDYALRKGREVLLIDTDDSNTDVAKCYLKNGKPVDAVRILTSRMDDEEGLKNILRTVVGEKQADISVVINAKAGGIAELEQHGAYLKLLVRQLGPNVLRTLWVINPYQDALQLLVRFLKIVPDMPIDVVMPLAWGEVRHYKLYNESNTKKNIEAHGGKSAMFPRFGFDQLIGLYCDRDNLTTQWEKGDFIAKDEIEQLRHKIDAFFDALNGGRP